MFKRILIGLAVIMGFALIFQTPAFAADFKTDENNVNIGTSEVFKNLYTASGTVTIDAPVKGDLVVAGGSIMVNGNVEENLFVAGGNVTIRGDVGKNARITGGTVLISGKVNGDLFIGAGTVTINNTTLIGGDLFIGGGTVSLAKPTVLGSTKIVGGMVSIEGNFKSVRIETDEQISVKQDTKIDGKFSYGSAKEAKIDSKAVITGSIDRFRDKPVKGTDFNKFFTFFSIIQLLGSILLGLLLLRFFFKSFKTVAEIGLKKPWENMGVGFATVVLVPIIMIILLFTVIGIPVVMVIGQIYFLLLGIGAVIGKTLFGMIIIRFATKEKDMVPDWQAIAVGILAIGLLGLIPMVGWIFNFIAFIWGVGALTYLFGSRLKAEQTTTPTKEA